MAQLRLYSDVKEGILMRTRSVGRSVAALAAGLTLAALTVVTPAMADDLVEPAPPAEDAPVSGALDPTTFEGEVFVLTPQGPVQTEVKAGELPTAAAAIREEVAAGRMTTDAEALKSCLAWRNAVAGPATWWTSGNGCAIIGYVGSTWGYQWNNASDMMICARGKGFTNNGIYWPSAGCSNSGGGVTVQWGNTLAYAQMKGLSISTITAAAYNWR